MRLRLGILFFAFLTSVHSQEANTEELSETVDIFLAKSSSAQDISKLLGILGNNTKRFESKLAYVPSINPLNPKKLKRISSKFGRRFHPVDKKNKLHLGIDISAKKGTPVHVSAKGVVIETISSSKGYGNQVVVEHAYGFITRYAHLHSFIVKRGDTLNKGKIIGFVGNTGKSTGYHLHYEIIKDDKPIDPYPFCFFDL